MAGADGTTGAIDGQEDATDTIIFDEAAQTIPDRDRATGVKATAIKTDAPLQGQANNTVVAGLKDIGSLLADRYGCRAFGATHTAHDCRKEADQQ